MSQFTTPTTPTGPQAQPEFPLAAEPPLTSVAPVTGDPDYYRKIAALSKANGEWSLNQLTYDVSIDQWTGFQIGRLAARVRASQEDVDPTFDIFSRWDDFTDGVAPAYWEDIARARSEGEANILKAQFQDTTDRRQRIAEAGVAGTVATVAATFMDPPQVAIMLGSGGLGAAIGGARGGFLATRAGMAVSSGLINAGTQLPLDVLRSADDPSFGGGDIAGNFIGNFAFGAQQPLTAGFNRATRFLAGGAAQSLGAPLQFRGEDFSNADAQVAMATQFFFGGAFNAIPAVRNPLIDAEAVRLAKLARDIADEADVNAAVTLRVGTPTPKANETIARNRRRREAPGMSIQQFGEALASTRILNQTADQLGVQPTIRPASERLQQRTDALGALVGEQPRPVDQTPLTQLQSLIDSFGKARTTDEPMALDFTVRSLERRGLGPRSILKDGTYVFASQDAAQAFVRESNGVLAGTTGRFFSATQVMGSDTWIVTRKSAKAVFDENLSAWKSQREDVEREIELAYLQDDIEARRSQPDPPDSYAIPLALPEPAQPRRFWDEAQRIARERALQIEMVPTATAMSPEAVQTIVQRRNAADAAGLTRPILDRIAYGMSDAQIVSVVRNAFGDLPVTEAKNLVTSVRMSAGAPQVGTPQLQSWAKQYRDTFGLADPASPSNPMTARNLTIIAGSDIGLGGTSIAARMAGFSRVSLDASYKPGDYDLSGVTFDSMEGAERIISRMSIFSQGSQIANSDKMPLRLMAAMVMGDMRGENSASGLVQRGARQRQFDSAWGQTRDKAREAFNKQQSEAGLPTMSAGDFDNLVGESYRKMLAGVRSENPHVQSVLDFMVQQQAKGLADSKRKGDASAMDVPDTAMHPNQIWVRDRIDGAVETYGHIRVKEALAEAIMPASRRRVAAAFAERNGDQTLFDFRVADQEQLIEAAARVQAETQADSIIRNGGTQKDVLAQINGIPIEMSLEATIAAYRANPLLRTLSDEQVEALVRQMKQDQAMPPIYRAAIEIDQNYTHRWLENTFGPGTQGEMRELRIMDMLDNSAEAMMKRWNNAHEGRLAMLELERAYSSVTQPGGGTSDPARQRLFVTPGQFETYMRQQLTDGIGDLASADESALNALRHHVKLLAGAPTYVPGSDRAEGAFRMVNGLSSVTSARVMMNPTAPIQNLTEVATALAHSHPAVAAKAVPELDQMMKALANGVDDPELRHYAFVMGMGQNLASGRPLGLLDDAAPAVVGTGKSTLLKAGQKVQAAGQTAGHYAYKLSGNTSTQDAAEMGVTMIAMKHFRLAADGEIKWRAADLEQFGLSQQRFESIVADMQAHRVKNDLGFYNLNEDKWQPENAAAFRRALLGWTTRYGNVMNAGLMPSYTTNNILGRMLTQLSRFGIQSWQNRALQPAFNVARAAPGHKGEALAMAATSYITQSVGASAAYALGVYLNSIGRPDAEEYRNQMLSKEMLALTLYSRAAWSSLTPRIMDVGLQLAGANSIFAPMRSSGLGTGSGPLGVAGQTPLGSWIYSAFSMPLAIAETLYSDEREWTTRDQRRLEETLLFPSAYMNLRNINAHLYQTVGIPTPEEVRESRESTRQFVSPN